MVRAAVEPLLHVWPILQTPQSIHELVEKAGVVKAGWNGFNVIHESASRVAALDLGFTPSPAAQAAPPAKVRHGVGLWVRAGSQGDARCTSRARWAGKHLDKVA